MAKKRKKGAAEAAQAGPGGSLGGRIGELKEFFEQSKVELKKVTWPSKNETIKTCIAVLVFTVVVSIFLGLADLGISKVIAAILS